jgi:poly(3-hydroxybutyrate) depolymerase
MKSFITALLLLAAPLLRAEDAPRLNIDPERITVAGLSAGGQMAHQLHIAYSDLFSGVAVIAGGPFGCAAGSVATAFARCMATTGDGLPLEQFAADLRAAAASGHSADPAGLADDPVWLFHGTLDTTVAAGVSDALAEFYAGFVPAGNIRYVDDIPAAHHFPALGHGHACDASQPPFVGDCGYDAAGELLNHLYPELAQPQGTGPTALRQVALPNAADAGLLETAYLFAPDACAGGAQSCALHLVLHGCAQSSAQLGTAFIEQSGYLPWAAANNIVLAFPQVAPGPANPYACWDWWGYTGAAYLGREAPQMRVLVDWLKSMLSA